MAEIKVTNRIKLGYSYDLHINELQPFNYGSHVIRLGFEIPFYANE